MVSKVVGEEIPAGLAINTVHGDQRGRLSTITSELEADTWSERLGLWIWFSGGRHSNDTGVSLSPQTSKWMVSALLQFNLSDSTLSVDQLLTVTTALGWHFIARCMQRWLHRLSENSGELKRAVPLLRGEILVNFSHDLVHLFLSRLGDVGWVIETWPISATSLNGGKSN